MCQSKENGGKRCDASLSGHSNYPQAIRLDKRTGQWVLNEENFTNHGSHVLHTAIVAARSGEQPSSSILELSRENSHLWKTMTPTERWGFWQDLTNLDNPSSALSTLHEMGWENNFPALANIRDVPQDPSWHPEGAVHIHSQQAADVAAHNATHDGLDSYERKMAVLGTLCHDMGKSTHTQIHEDGRITSKEHASAGSPIARGFLKDIGAPKSIVQAVPQLVYEHMCHANDEFEERAMRNLESRLTQSGATYEQLCRVIDADNGGRGSASRTGHGQKWLNLRADYHAREEARRNRPRPLMNGDFLQELGLKPGVWFGVLIAEYKAENRSDTRDEAAAWVRSYAAKHGIHI